MPPSSALPGVPSPTGWVVEMLGRFALSAQRLLPPARSADRPVRPAELMTTVVLLIVLMYLAIASLFRHLKDPLELRDLRRLGAPPLAARLRTYVHRWTTATLATSAFLYLGEATVTMVGALMRGKGASATPIRLVWFWSFHCLALCVEVALGSLALVALGRRVALATCFRGVQWRADCSFGSLGQLVTALNELDTSDILLSRLAFLGCTFAMSAYGR